MLKSRTKSRSMAQNESDVVTNHRNYAVHSLRSSCLLLSVAACEFGGSSRKLLNGREYEDWWCDVALNSLPFERADRRISIDASPFLQYIAKNGGALFTSDLAISLVVSPITRSFPRLRGLRILRR
jgi:hypothetical protein